MPAFLIWKTGRCKLLCSPGVVLTHRDASFSVPCVQCTLVWHAGSVASPGHGAQVVGSRPTAPRWRVGPGQGTDTL